MENKNNKERRKTKELMRARRMSVCVYSRYGAGDFWVWSVCVIFRLYEYLRAIE